MTGQDLELRLLRARLEAQPDDLDAAELFARRAIEIGRAELDPRFFGYAQAALQRWLDAPVPPPEAVVLGAIVEQSRHDFDAALSHLNGVLERDPRNAQAYLTSASILQVKGEHRLAMERCGSALLLPAARVSATVCLAKSLAATGRAAAAEGLLLPLIDHASVPARERLWAITVLAESLARRGDAAKAAQRFEQGVALELRDVYLLTAYADFLLDSGEPERVRDLLRDETLADGLLLRLALAERRLGLVIDGRVTSLRARFGASRRRGDAIHFGDEARFALEILDDPPQALALARENWRRQREPRDVRLLLETALAAGDRQAAKGAIDAVRASALEDVRVADLVARLERAP